MPRIIDSKLAHDATFRDRYSAELEAIEKCNKRLVGLAALYWRYKTDSFFSYREEGFPILAVSYERLVTNPRPTLHAVCAHLGIAFHENLLRHNEFEHAELFENGLTLGNTNPSKPIQQDSVGQWPLFLSEEDIEVISRITGDLPERVESLTQRES